MKKSKSTPRRRIVLNCSASDLAAKLARAVFACGDDRSGECRRIEFKIGSYPHNEKPGGGLCEAALADLLLSNLTNNPVTDAEPSTPANTRAQGPRSV